MPRSEEIWNIRNATSYEEIGGLSQSLIAFFYHESFPRRDDRLSYEECTTGSRKVSLSPGSFAKGNYLISTN